MLKKLNRAATQDATQWKGSATSVGTGLFATCPQFWFNVDMTSHAAFIDWITMLKFDLVQDVLYLKGIPNNMSV